MEKNLSGDEKWKKGHDYSIIKKASLKILAVTNAACLLCLLLKLQEFDFS